MLTQHGARATTPLYHTTACDAAKLDYKLAVPKLANNAAVGEVEALLWHMALARANAYNP